MKMIAYPPTACVKVVELISIIDMKHKTKWDELRLEYLTNNL